MDRRPLRFVAASAALAASTAAGACAFDLPDVRPSARDADADDAPPGTRDGGGGASDGSQEPAARDGAGPSCDAYFCDDFDEGEPLAARWTALFTEGGAAVGIATTGALSPPAALVASTPRMDVTMQSVAYVRSKDPLPAYSRGRFAYAFYFDDVTRTDGHALTGFVSIGGVWFVTILLHPDGSMELVERTRDDAGALVYPTRATFGPLPLDRWTRFVMDVTPPGDGGAPAGSVSVSIDGNTVADAVPITSPYVVGERRFAVGLSNVQGPSGAWTVQVDDVRIELDCGATPCPAP